MKYVFPTHHGVKCVFQEVTTDFSNATDPLHERNLKHKKTTATSKSEINHSIDKAIDSRALDFNSKISEMHSRVIKSKLS